MNNNQDKLINLSQRILIITKILLIVLLLIAFIPWIFPKTEISSFLLSLQNFHNVFNNSEVNINKINMGSFMMNLTISSKLFGLLGSCVKIVPLALSIFLVGKLTKNYLSLQIFSLSNACYYRWIGIIYLVNALLFEPLSQSLFSLAITFANPIGHRVIAFSFGINNLDEIFVSMILILIGVVMQIAYAINQEQDLTI